jgi:hypothetical protein
MLEILSHEMTRHWRASVVHASLATIVGAGLWLRAVPVDAVVGSSLLPMASLVPIVHLIAGVPGLKRFGLVVDGLSIGVFAVATIAIAVGFSGHDLDWQRVSSRCRGAPQ